MTNATMNDIWVFGDLRSRPLLDTSFKVVAKAAALAQKTEERVVMFMLTAAKTNMLIVSENEACTVQGSIEDEAFAWGADVVVYLENEDFSTPTAHLFAGMLAPVFADQSPRLVLFPLTDFGRDLAARVAATARAGLIADCVDLQTDQNGRIVGLCPAWGGEIMSEITYAPGHGTGYATVHPHGATGEKDPDRTGRVEHIQLADAPEAKGIRLVSSKPAVLTDEDLENARTVVVGGAGLGSMENFGLVRQLAAAMAAQVAATRPPVLDHWVAEDRLIGQTGRTVRPDLLFSVGTSGAVQYTAGISESGTIVAINRDPAAPIFRLADIGVVADAPTFLPLLIARTRQAVLRRLADAVCTDMPLPVKGSAFGEKIRALREGPGLVTGAPG